MKERGLTCDQYIVRQMLRNITLAIKCSWRSLHVSSTRLWRTRLELTNFPDNICLFLFTKVFYVVVNQRRAKIWDAMSKEEKENYLSTTKDEGNKRLDFRFAH